MPPRLNLFRAHRSLAIRTRSSIGPGQPRITVAVAHRCFADQKKPPVTGPNEHGLGHVSEEAADVGKVMGKTQPDLGRSTPVQEIFERDEKSKEKAPEVIKKEMEDTKTAPTDSTAFANIFALGQMQNIADGGHGNDPVEVGHKHGLPELPLPPTSNLHHRYDPVVDQVTNLLMKHGKLSVAQRNMSFILNHLRTAPPPVPNPAKPLLPGAPPPAHLPLNPIGYLTLAIDSIAPLLRIRSQRGAAGGGAALQIPVPLGLRQRRRTAVQWILDAANKRESRGSGRGQFAHRVAEEIIRVVEGKSSAWDKRMLVHKTGTSSRANLMYRKRGKR